MSSNNLRRGYTDKRCPKCGGNIFLEIDDRGNWFELCIQCGKQQNLQILSEPSGTNERSTGGEALRRQ